MRKLLLVSACIWLVSVDAFGSGSPFTSVTTGPWNDGATWGNTPGGVAGTDYPDAGQSATISAGNTVTVPSGTFKVGSLTMNSSSSALLNVNGTLEVDGQINFLSASRPFITVGSGGIIRMKDGSSVALGGVTPAGPLSRFTISSGGTYEMNYTTGGTVPNIIYSTGSLLKFTGYTSFSAVSPAFESGVSLKDVEWNCPTQGNDISFNGVIPTIAGNLTINDTGSLSPANVPGYFIFTRSATSSLTITGNLNINNGSFVILSDGTGAFDLTVNGNINVSGTLPVSPFDGSELDMKQGSGVGTIHSKGNFSLTGGAKLSSAGSGAGSFIFEGTGVQTFTNSSSAITNQINFRVTTPSTVDLGTGVLSGTGTFTLDAGGSIRVGSADGLSRGVNSLGNIQVTGTRTYNTGANILYNGSVSQNLGDEWGSSGALNGIAVNLEIANSGGGVTNNVTGSTSVVGNLTLTSGSLNIGNSTTLTIQSNFIGNGGSIGGNSNSNLSFSGSGTTSGTIKFTSGSQILQNFTISRAGTFILDSDLTIHTTGALAFTSTGNLQISNATGVTLTVNGNITQSGSGGITSSNSSSNLVIGGSGALTTLPLTGTTLLNNVTFNRSGGASYTWASVGQINGTLTLSDGSLTHSSGLTMINGSTLSRSSGTSFLGSAPNTTGSYNVIYTGNLTTSLELPSSSTALNNLTVAGNVTLDKSITVNGNVDINSGTLDASTNDVTLGGAQFNVNGGTFTINAARTVTFARSGITVVAGSSVNNTQFGNVTINSGATLNSPNANLNVSGTWVNNGTFTANSGTITFNGGSQNLNPNGQSFNNVTFGGSGTKTLLGQLDAAGALTINSGATLDVGANQAINVAGTWANGGTFTAGGGTVTFNGASQTVNPNGQAFFNLTLANSGTKTLGSALTVGGNLTINSSVTLDVSTNSYGISVAGNWVNNGTFTRRTGTVTFNGTTSISGSGAFTFFNVTTTGALTAPSGTLDVAGNWLQSSGTFTHNSGTLQFSGNSQSITPGGQQFNSVTISGTNTKTLQGTTVINGVLTLSGGTFDTNGQPVTLRDNFVSNSASVLTSSTITFTGTTILSGSVNPTFGAVTLTAGTLTPNAAFNINGNLVNNGTLNAGSGTVTFGGNTTISGGNTCSFNNVVVSSTLTAPVGTINVAGSWTNNGTFNANGGTVVFNGSTSVSGSSTSSFNVVSISGSLTAPSTTMNVGGNFSNSGTFNNNGGKVVFNGSSTQSITGTATFRDIDANNASGLNINGTIRLDGILTLNASGVFDADGSGSGIFIVSSTSQTAGGMIAALPTPSNFSGNVMVERYIQGQTGGDYRFISMPITNGNLGLWKSSIFVTGNFSDPSTNSDNSNITNAGNTNASVFTYDANTQAYVAVSGGGGTVASVGLSSRTGYAAYDFNDGPVTASYHGAIETGNVPITISTVNNNFNLTPNPYPSPIDWDNVTKTNVNNAMWLRSSSNTYSSYVNGVVAGPLVVSGWTGEVATGQSFWTQSNGGGSTLTFKETDKTSNSSKFLRVTAPDNYVRVQIKSGNQQDDMVIRFVAGAGDNLDSEYDAVKRRNGNYISALGRNSYMNISSYNTAATSDYAINTIGKIADGDSKLVKMRVFDIAAGSYTLTFTDISTMTLGYRITLIDNFLNRETIINDNSTYDFAVTADPASVGDARFALRFEGITVITGVEAGEVDVQAYPNPVVNKLSIKLSQEIETNLNSIVLFDITGRQVVSSERDVQLLSPGLKTIEMNDFTSGVYILSIKSGNFIKSIRVIKR